MPRPFPSFAAPPVTEVVIATRFEPAPTYSVLEVAELARSAASKGFSVVQEVAGYEAPVERFGQSVGGNQFSLELLAGPPPVRYWFLNPAGDQLLQTQRNWAAANWRKVTPTAEYGRWDNRWHAFLEWIDAVDDVLFPGGSILPEQVEVTYVNHIEACEVWEGHRDAHKVFSFLSDPLGGKDFLGPPEQTTAELSFVIPDPASTKPIGRLHVVVTPAYKRPTNEPIFILNLTARGSVETAGPHGIRLFAETAHEWIVRSFADLTTPEMHRSWERNDYPIGVQQ